MNLIEDKLTKREEEIYHYLLQGLNYTDIARAADIEKSTVVTHIMNIYLKKMVTTRAELMAQRIEELENTILDLTGTNSNTRA
jgi:DNA-binding NarL/FixJ family response regulator